MTIRPDEISIVVQGPINGKFDDPPAVRLTAACLASIRQHLSGAEIILSTWAGSDVRGLDFDQLVESADPGAKSFWRDSNWAFSLNRQIRSSAAGLRLVTRPYAMKLRSDMRIDGTAFLGLFERYPARHPDWQVFERRVVACTVISQNVRRWGLSLCPSDWVHFGTTADVRKLWDIPEDEGDTVSQYFLSHPRPVPDKNAMFLCRYAVEQYIWLNCIRKHAPVQFDHLWDTNDAIRQLTELTFANNLILADEMGLQITFCKYPQPRLHHLLSTTPAEWLALYRRHCDPKFRGVPTLRLLWDRSTRKGELLARKVWDRVKMIRQRVFGRR